jgi:3-methylcrotonyl-CoA carboxylase alpha subunit
MFKKILVANRGEIAVRIIATCREMGIQTVAVYSEVDRRARHVREADEAYLLGPAPAHQSYLNSKKIIEIAQQSQAEAIHPGYGFLSENADFVEACEQAGLVFIGPPASAMRLMGSKISAKEIAESVGAPTVPGYKGQSQAEEVLASEALRIGFPLLIKASAGGGGKGMRVVDQESTLLEQLAGAKREALAAFGDDTVFLERLVQQPRHIEIQILGDTFGELIHLGERECSIQRRHQKIVEESPSVALSPELRAEMGEAAVRIARAAGYTNAGTLEFMLDPTGHYYFLEMNTRLQVEHPVTEYVTGLDLVRHQLMIAAGQPLGITQEQIKSRGHAIEVRLYAEDPALGFLPSTGTVSGFVTPEGPGIRVDNGIESGDEVTQYYDPMLAKLITYGEDRSAAIERLRSALERCAIFGVNTNLELLHTIAQHPAFYEGQTTTSFLTDYHLLDFDQPSSEPLPGTVLFAAALSDLQGQALDTPGKPFNPWQSTGSWQIAGGTRRLTYRYQDQEQTILARPLSRAQEVWSLQLNEQEPVEVSEMDGGKGRWLLRIGEQQIQTFVRRSNGETRVFLHGRSYSLQNKQPPDVDLTGHGGNVASSQKALNAPMAGTIVKVQVVEGQEVSHRQVLVVLTAMKMEHSVVAPYDGKIRKVHCHEGEVVRGGAVVVEME